MAFTVADVDDFVRVLRTHPEWREAVRQEVLGAELLSLPELVRQNGEDIRALSAEMRALEALVAQNSRDIAQNSEDIRALSAEMRALEAVVAQNSEDIRQISRDMQRMLRTQVQANGRIGHLQGVVDESRWQRGFAGRFGRMVHRARLLTPRDLDRFEDAVEAGTISLEDGIDVRHLDLIVEGVPVEGPKGTLVILAVEVSARIEAGDVTRALARAATLRRVGYTARPVVAGAVMDEPLQALAGAQGVAVVLRPEDLTEFATYLDDIQPRPGDSRPGA